MVRLSARDLVEWRRLNQPHVSVEIKGNPESAAEAASLRDDPDPTGWCLEVPMSAEHAFS
ncbi:MAG: hypothetical protein N2037_09875 [Acidimicrobiales bacterium]|nr:hypothetical protein [Acidimicrobiales bacterium]